MTKPTLREAGLPRKPRPVIDDGHTPATSDLVHQLVALAKPLVQGWFAEALDAQKPRPRWVDGDAACTHLNCSAPTLKKLAEQGMPHILIGDHRRYDLAQCDAWLLDRSTPKAGE